MPTAEIPPMAAAISYHEPDILQILIQSSFLLVLNIVNSLFNKWLSCGLVAQLIVGIAYGTPGGKLLAADAENLITSLGYLGLILVVFEGGLATSIPSLRANLRLSTVVAITGIAVPIGLAFVLQRLANATPLQAFAAGAALCSTSLGTTFAVLRASGFASTRLGSVLTAAAMLDDVVGLVMVQVIANLDGAFQVSSVVRPVGVSIGFAALALLLCWGMRLKFVELVASRLQPFAHSAFLLQTIFLLAMVTAASYAGTSNLFSAYLAGVCVNWWYVRLLPLDPASPSTSTSAKGASTSGSGDKNSSTQTKNPLSSGIAEGQPETIEENKVTIPAKIVSPAGEEALNHAMNMYEKYYSCGVERLLKPFFFASIGFAIPITQMFQGAIIWRGFIFALLMTLAKMSTGLWLVPFRFQPLGSVRTLYTKAISTLDKSKKPRQKEKTDDKNSPCTNPRLLRRPPQGQPQSAGSRTDRSGDLSPASDSPTAEHRSLYPASILGMAMVPRGEIGFLIAATAYSSGIFDQDGAQVLYLTTIWAVVLCTVIGPVSTGLLVKRVKQLEKTERASSNNERSNPLGPWGVA